MTFFALTLVGAVSTPSSTLAGICTSMSFSSGRSRVTSSSSVKYPFSTHWRTEIDVSSFVQDPIQNTVSRPMLWGPFPSSFNDRSPNALTYSSVPIFCHFPSARASIIRLGDMIKGGNGSWVVKLPSVLLAARTAPGISLAAIALFIDSSTDSIAPSLKVHLRREILSETV